LTQKIGVLFKMLLIFNLRRTQKKVGQKNLTLTPESELRWPTEVVLPGRLPHP
jgi:hypothetical protein